MKSSHEHIDLKDIKLPSELERQQIFYLLRKISSVTAWKRVLAFYQAWVDVAESSLREADDRGWGALTSLPHSEYVFLLKCLAHCEEGVRRLRQGDKRVFKYDANGEFVMAARGLAHYSQLVHRIEIGENQIDEEHTPLWGPFCMALKELGQAWGECGSKILEPRYEDDPALLRYNDWLSDLLKKTPFPKELQLIPDPQNNVFVRTGSLTPCSGIWEPIDAPRPSLVMSIMGKSAKPLPPFSLMGCMNYLHSGSPAPSIRAYTGENGVNLPTAWRLLWKDDRYKDGLIPEEEADYCFTQPESERSVAPAWSVDDQIIWAESGVAAPATGKWLVESDMAAGIDLNEGDLLPLHQGRKVRWVMAH
ncbi:Imm71 family immunity protein [Herbaspirillum seropedicae]|uniref:Imm71 family immunity protein n=1 Tax=Herbaspirillum seropedicae TaxID=964 RepID=UPI003F8D412B